MPRLRLEITHTVPNPLPPGVAPFTGQSARCWRSAATTGGTCHSLPPAHHRRRTTGPPPVAEAVVVERKLFVSSTPHGFVKAAAANKATSRRSGGSTEVTFTQDGKYRVVGRLNAQNQVERVQTWIDNPVLGDMLVETTYSGYRDFGGVSFRQESSSHKADIRRWS